MKNRSTDLDQLAGLRPQSILPVGAINLPQNPDRPASRSPSTPQLGLRRKGCAKVQRVSPKAEMFEAQCTRCRCLGQPALDELVSILRAKTSLLQGWGFVRRGSCPALWFHGAGRFAGTCRATFGETPSTTFQPIPRVHTRSRKIFPIFA